MFLDGDRSEVGADLILSMDLLGKHWSGLFGEFEGFRCWGKGIVVDDDGKVLGAGCYRSWRMGELGSFRRWRQWQ